MKSPARIIAKILQDSGTAATDQMADWFPYVSSLPDKPGVVPVRAMAVTDTVGLTDGRIMATGEYIEHPGIQIRIRGTGYSDTYAKIQEAQAVMDSLMNHTVTFDDGESRTVCSASRTSTLGIMGYDSTGTQYHLSINYKLTLKVV